ncbi:amidohydrolase family protein [bacterium]|nr:amidohydrolase family protein [bacterium]
MKKTIETLIVSLSILWGNSPQSAPNSTCDLNRGEINPSSMTLIKNATIINPEKKESYPGHLLIEKNKIKKILKCTILPELPHSLRQLDRKGQWLLPGLMDLHVHNWGDNVPPRGAYGEEFHDFVTQEEMGHRMLRAGQTSYLDLFAPSDAGDNPDKTMGSNIFELRRRQRDQKIVHPNVYVSGPLFVVDGGHSVAGFPDAITIKVKDDKGQALSGKDLDKRIREVKSKVKKLIQSRNPNVIKFVYDSHKDSPISADREDMPLVIAKSIIEEAKANNKKTVAHVGSWKAVGDLAELGLNAFTHLPSGPAPNEVIESLVRNHVSAITTIAIYSDIGLMKNPSEKKSILENTLLKMISPLSLLVSYWLPELYDESSKKFADWSAEQNEIESQKQALMSLYKGGVHLIAGSDGGNVGTIIGYTLHRELLHMEKFGMNRWDVLESATSHSGRFLDNNRGVIAEGAIADLIILKKSPLSSISNLQTIESVILGGRAIELEGFEN